ncbi:flagellar type III secretion system pore protein FliP [Candidatus Lariskella endosymbiont of Hedychridium roseum]|uniref:flagellar type III secretion system pore protein FliP n=1 Tax=Candidatus Lariskella endosymbiont of Hedychridium roseum TaxID=3077949 RepID=UPI0030D2B4A2
MRNVILLFLILLFCFECTAFAEGITIDLGIDSHKDGSTVFTSKIIQLIGILTILSLAPSILIMVTSFTRIAIVLSFVRSALGLQQTPPNIVLISLALFLTFFIMAPTFTKSYEDGLLPLMNNSIGEEQAFASIAKPFHSFMLQNTGNKERQLFLDIAKLDNVSNDEIPFHVLIPAFMISELKRAFEIGFLIFLPFLIIDMLIASVLMAMGMMMVPPAMIALPFKLVFFVLIDGWYMICGSIIKSYGIG